MVTFDDLRIRIDQAEREERDRAEERERREPKPTQGQPQEEQKRAEEQRIYEERSRIEKERWGTPQKAYKTWQSRTRELLTLLSDYGKSKRQEAQEARRAYGNVTGLLNHWEIYITFFSERAKARKVKVEQVKASDFSYNIQGLGSELTRYLEAIRQFNDFSLMKGGDQIYLRGECARDMEVTLRSAYQKPALLWKNFSTWTHAAELERAVRRILIPTIIADRIEARMSAIHFALAENESHGLGENLRSGTLPYEFSCTYNLSSIEDSLTWISFPTLKIHKEFKIHNPGNRKSVDDVIGYVNLTTWQPETSGSNANQYGCR